MQVLLVEHLLASMFSSVLSRDLPHRHEEQVMLMRVCKDCSQESKRIMESSVFLSLTFSANKTAHLKPFIRRISSDFRFFLPLVRSRDKYTLTLNLRSRQSP